MPNTAPPEGRQVVLVTGSSSGIGMATCARLAGDGHVVFGASRSPTEAGNWTHLSTDVTSEASVAEAVAAVRGAAGRIDALVHCAGISVAGALEDVSLAEAQAQFDTNYFGTVRVTRAVLPLMRAQGGGRIMIIGSIGGLIGLPFLGHYSASKFAVDGFVQALRCEVGPFGVQATAIHPGDMRTNIAKNQVMAEAAGAASVYRDACDRMIELTTKSVDAAPQPEVVARLVARLMARRRLAPAYIIGSPVEKAAVGLKAWLPGSSFEFIFRKAYGL